MNALPALSWLNAPAWLPLIHALLHTLWQGALAAGGLFLGLRFVPAHRPGLRYGLSTAALTLVVLIGVGSWALLDAPRRSSASTIHGDHSITTATEQLPEGLPPSASAIPLAPTGGGFNTKTADINSIVSSPDASGARRWVRWAVASWLTGAWVSLLRALRGTMGAGRLQRRCRDLADPHVLALVEQLRTRLGVTRRVRFLVSDEIGVPSMLGVLYPAVLLPASLLTGVPLEQIRAILAHELAHVRRWDYLANLGQMLVEALLFFNPFVWWISRQMRLEREACCDQVAARECQSPACYVEALVAVIERGRLVATAATSPMLAASGPEARGGNALERARRLLVPGYQPAFRIHWFSLTAILMLSVSALSGLWWGTRAVAQTISGNPEPSLPHVIDLTPFHTKTFRDPAIENEAYASYAGARTIDGLPFEIGGEIILSGQEDTDHGGSSPGDLSGIGVGRNFDELHLVHAAKWREYPGCQIATIRLHYADGSQSDLPIQYNYQVSDWDRLYSEENEIVADPATKIVWRGKAPFEGEGRLFKSVLINPHPDRRVDTMEIISNETSASYILIAATVARRDPTRAVTPSMPLRPSRQFGGLVRVRVTDAKTGAPIAGAQVYPIIGISHFNLVADKVLTAADGLALAKYPKDTTKFLTLAISAAGYVPFNQNIQFSWDLTEIPEAITYKLAPQGDTDPGDQVSTFTVEPSSHPTLVTAVKQGDAVSVQKLIEQGADISKVEVEGSPLLFVAGSPEVASVLLAHGADPNACNKRKMPALIYFCGGYDIAQHSGFARVLLEHGADPNAREPDGSTPLMRAQDVPTLEVLVAHGADLKARNSEGATVLECAVNYSLRTDDTPQGQARFIEELIKRGAEFDPEGNGVRAMIAAAFRDQASEVRVFLDHGVSPNASYERGSGQYESALSAAALQAPKSLKLLLERGADPNAPLPAGHLTPLEAALAWGAFGNVDLLRQAGAKGLSDLAYASAKGDLTKVNELLDQHADPNEAGSSGWTPLIYAVKRTQVEVARRLLDHGASVDQFDGFGFSSYLEFTLYRTMIEQDSSQAQLQWHLSPQEAKARLASFEQLFTQHPPNFAYRNSAGWTALHQAAWAGNSMISGLMLAGHPPRFDPNLPDKEGRTPLLLVTLSPVAKDTREIITTDLGTPQQKKWNQQARLADELLKAGARLDLPGPGGKTVGELALAAAHEANNAQLVDVLTEAMYSRPAAPPVDSPTLLPPHAGVFIAPDVNVQGTSIVMPEAEAACEATVTNSVPVALSSSFRADNEVVAVRLEVEPAGSADDPIIDASLFLSYGTSLKLGTAVHARSGIMKFLGAFDAAETAKNVTYLAIVRG